MLRCLDWYQPESAETPEIRKDSSGKLEAQQLDPGLCMAMNNPLTSIQCEGCHDQGLLSLTQGVLINDQQDEHTVIRWVTN